MISSPNNTFSETGSLPKKAPVSLNDFSSYCTQFKGSSGKLPNRKDLEIYFKTDKLLDKTTILGLFFLHNRFQLPLAPLLGNIDDSFYSELNNIQQAVDQLFGHNELQLFFDQILKYKDISLTHDLESEQSMLFQLIDMDLVEFYRLSFKHVFTSSTFHYQKLPDFVKSEAMYHTLIQNKVISDVNETMDTFCLNCIAF